MFVYRRIDADNRVFYRVGFYDQLDVRERWIAVKEFDVEEDAAAYVSYLNGGSRPPQKPVRKPATS